MSPKGNHHEVVKTALADRWYRLPECDVDLAIATTFRLSEDTYLEPDVVIFPETSGIPGLAADNVLLVVEIADSSLSYDIGRKAALYASFSIRELWVIDAVRLTTRVFREPAADGYRNASDFGRPIDSFRSSRPRPSPSSSTSWSWRDTRREAHSASLAPRRSRP
jgi:Uma2 family endonuclease